MKNQYYVSQSRKNPNRVEGTGNTAPQTQQTQRVTSAHFDDETMYVLQKDTERLFEVELGMILYAEESTFRARSSSILSPRWWMRCALARIASSSARVIERIFRHLAPAPYRTTEARTCNGDFLSSFFTDRCIHLVALSFNSVDSRIDMPTVHDVL